MTDNPTRFQAFADLLGAAVKLEEQWEPPRPREVLHLLVLTLRELAEACDNGSHPYREER